MDSIVQYSDNGSLQKKIRQCALLQAVDIKFQKNIRFNMKIQKYSVIQVLKYLSIQNGDLQLQ